jgi:NAD(P)-dependent dehydrogenase (short-subunit alcohol dehydrogenase family)
VEYSLAEISRNGSKYLEQKNEKRNANRVGAAVAFLASPSAFSINGINLPVDGGLAASL